PARQWLGICTSPPPPPHHQLYPQRRLAVKCEDVHHHWWCARNRGHRRPACLLRPETGCSRTQSSLRSCPSHWLRLRRPFSPIYCLAVEDNLARRAHQRRAFQYASHTPCLSPSGTHDPRTLHAPR
ncbi:hypothetical protein PUNSTDRAFT_108401, partial [Punctularia strigosozonata HHB-11173 SS5]